MPNASNRPHFDIHASVVFQLGESLISDEVQALVELVKNAYDADATYAKVTISTGVNDYSISHYPLAEGYIAIEDNGTGMDMETIGRGWLTISNSLKRQLKRELKTTERGRTPLGDKGLGRLGAQRLGANLEILTRTTRSSTGYHVAFSWDDFIACESLTSVPVNITERTDLPVGTCVLVSGLRDIGAWRGEEEVTRLKRSLSQMISPYEEVQLFQVLLIVDGSTAELAAIPKRLRETSNVRYSIQFDGDDFKVIGRMRLGFIEPHDKDEREAFRKLVRPDQGEAFFRHLSTKSFARNSAMILSPEGGWFIEYSHSRKFVDYSPLELIDGIPANPGSFHGEIDSFDFAERPQDDLLGTVSEYKKYIDDLSGIRVYRDGFAIRVDADWLRLGDQWTEGRSYYGLKPKNTLGYIALSARDNALLEETTDREGFKTTPYYGNFYRMLLSFVKFSGDAHNFLRRQALEFVRKYREVAIGATDDSDTNITQRIATHVEQIQSYQTPLEALNSSLSQATIDAQAEISDSDATLFQDPKLIETIRSLEHHIKQAQVLIAEVSIAIKDSSQIGNLSKVLSDRIALLHEQLSLVYEAVGLGLTAEILSHEIHNITDRLSNITKQMKDHLRKEGVSSTAFS